MRNQYSFLDEIKNNKNKQLKPVSEKFLENVKDIEDKNKIHISVKLDGSRDMIENMINFIDNRILKFMNFSDRLKVLFKLDDSDLRHYEYFNCDNIKYLYEKFSNKNWDIVTDYMKSFQIKTGI